MVGPGSRQLRAARPLRFAVEIGFGDCVEILRSPPTANRQR